MSILSVKRRVVAAASLAVGLQGALIAPSIAADTDPATQPIVAGHPRADSHIPVLSAHREEGGTLLTWSGFSPETAASNILVKVALYTSSGDYAGRMERAPGLRSGGVPGEFSFFLPASSEDSIVYAVTLTDSAVMALGLSHTYYLGWRGDSLVPIPDPRTGSLELSPQGGLDPSMPIIAVPPPESSVEHRREEEKPNRGGEEDNVGETGNNGGSLQREHHVLYQGLDTSWLEPLSSGLLAIPLVSTTSQVRFETEAESAPAPENPALKGLGLKSPLSTSIITGHRQVIAQVLRKQAPVSTQKRPRLTVQNSRVHSSDNTKPVTVRGRDFPMDKNGYDLMVVELDAHGNTVGDAPAIVHVGPEALSSGTFEAVLGMPGTSLRTGGTYLVMAMDASGEAYTRVSTVRFTVSREDSASGSASVAGWDVSSARALGASSVKARKTEKPREAKSATAKPHETNSDGAKPSAADSGGISSGEANSDETNSSNANSEDTKNWTSEESAATPRSSSGTGEGTQGVRSIRPATAMSPDTQDATISIADPVGEDRMLHPSVQPSSELGYRTREGQDLQTLSPDANLPTGNDSAAQSRRASILNGSSSQVRSETGSREGVKASETRMTRGVMNNSPFAPILLVFGSGMMLGALRLAKAHTSRRD